MDEEIIRDKLRQFSEVMDNFSLETVKIAKVQADLVDVRKENTILMGKVGSLEQETTILKNETTILKNEITMLKDQNETVLEKVSKLGNENTVLKDELSNLKSENTNLKGELGTLKKANIVLRNIVDELRKDVQMLKSIVMSKEVSNEQESDIAGETNKSEPVGTKKEGNSDSVRRQSSNVQESDIAGGKNEAEPVEEEKTSAVGSQVGRKPKMQRKKEQNVTFRNWRKTMAQRKTSEELWASGLLKVTIELWEDEGIYMDGEQILDFIRRNVDQFTTYMSLEESKKRFFLTIIKMCSMRKVSKQKFQEIMLCFVNQGPRNNRIAEPEVRKFMEMYKE